MKKRIVGAMLVLCAMSSLAQAAPSSLRPARRLTAQPGVADAILGNLGARLAQRRRGTLITAIRGNVSVDSTFVVPLIWNAWAEEGEAAPTFNAAPFLKPDTRYWVMLDLSPMGYWR